MHESISFTPCGLKLILLPAHVLRIQNPDFKIREKVDEIWQASVPYFPEDTSDTSVQTKDR